MSEPAAAAADSGDGQARVLLVDDDPTSINVMLEHLSRLGLKLLVAKSGEDALKVAARSHPDLVLLDVLMPGIDGFETCRQLKANPAIADAAVIFLSGLDDTTSKVRGLELGAVDFVTKPFEPAELVSRVKTHVTLQRLRRELEGRNRALEHELVVARELLAEARLRVETDLVGDSIAVRALREAIAEHARSDEAVLLAGPPGCGHEATARAIHHQSRRADRAFIHVNCSLLEPSTHAWHFTAPGDDGAGTSATAPGGEPSKLALAAGGTLYLDGIERMPGPIQERLSALLADRDAARAADVRIVAYAGADLDGEVARSRFNPRLHLALAGASVRIPALRERRDDIAELTRRFVSAAARRLGALAENVSDASLQRLRAYPWPGNLRELQGLLERAVVTSRGTTVEIDPELLEGGIRLGSYRLIDLLGSGGMGEVWRAKHTLLARPAAVKLVRSNVVSSAEGARAIARFRREAKATASLKSPHTVRLYDFGVSDSGELYYVMELLDGTDLFTLLKRFGPLPPGRAVHLVRQALLSLEEAHAAGLLHRDIKPANLYVCKLGSSCDFLKVLDFGIVKSMHDEEAAEAGLTSAGSLVGTPAYLPPEMIRAGGGPPDGRADLYAIGCVLYYLLTGLTPFTGDAMELFMHHLRTPPRPPSEVAKQLIPADLDALVLRCLAKTPDARPASARELRHRLGELRLEGTWSEARAEQWWEKHLPEFFAVAAPDPDAPDDLIGRGPQRIAPTPELAPPPVQPRPPG